MKERLDATTLGHIVFITPLLMEGHSQHRLNENYCNRECNSFGLNASDYTLWQMSDKFEEVSWKTCNLLTNKIRELHQFPLEIAEIDQFFRAMRQFDVEHTT
jgi:hypothetical protein